MSTTSRRAVLAGIAAVPAAAVPAVAALTLNAEWSDAELLRLGAELDDVAKEWLVISTRAEERLARFNAKVEQVTGIATRDAPNIDDDTIGYWDARMSISGDDFDGQAEDDRCNAMQARLFPLAEDILARRAQTIAGLAVQAKAITLAAADLWDEEDADGHDHERTFVEAVCAFVGITPVPLAGQRNVPASSRPAVSGDSIFAVIAAHRAAWTALGADCCRLDEEDTPEAEAKLDELHEAVSTTAGMLADCKPTTVAGAAALLRDVADQESNQAETEKYVDADDGKLKSWTFFVSHNVAKALDRLIASA